MTLPSLNDQMIEWLNGRMGDGITDFTFSNLEGVLQHELGMDSWRVGRVLGWVDGALGERALPTGGFPHVGVASALSALSA